MKKGRRKLLVPTALTAGALLWSCSGGKKEPEQEPEVFGNPKGAHYDEGAYDAGVDEPAPTAEPTADPTAVPTATATAAPEADE